ncbi:hypothetical protein OG897_13780 [Streptomyces sp. NBC_00237]|nr:hypothetical protein [Streptomyces sp. NBC_00237]MCX5202514.1 hypothetical protein [Streptomyces sp. NBC_00237]
MTGRSRYGYDLGFRGHTLCQYTVTAAADPLSIGIVPYSSPALMR